ncbi:MAG: formylglycine-generating enzyme family protein [Bdellovibrionales bacterium]|nr:formylglycine-generating enzyme family protein [Bdellovibrionales bacterium]
MRAVFLGLFCLGFLGPMAWGHHPEGEPLTGDFKSFKIEDLGFSFQEIPAGSFTMGSPADEKDRDEDEEQVEVTISKPFEMMATEVTQEQYFLVTGEAPFHFSKPKDCENWDKVRKICPNHPAENVSWYEAKEFIKELNASAGIMDCKGIPEDPRGCYRLPTEAEWEWAARAGTKTAYFHGDDPDPAQLGRYAVYNDNSGGGTHEVTTGWHNPNKLHGIYGNVWEWVEDSYKVKLAGGEDPLNRESECRFSEECRVLRGGSWASVRRACSRLIASGSILGAGTPMLGSAS